VLTQPCDGVVISADPGVRDDQRQRRGSNARPAVTARQRCGEGDRNGRMGRRERRRPGLMHQSLIRRQLISRRAMPGQQATQQMRGCARQRYRDDSVAGALTQLTRTGGHDRSDHQPQAAPACQSTDPRHAGRGPIRRQRQASLHSIGLDSVQPLEQATPPGPHKKQDMQRRHRSAADRPPQRLPVNDAESWLHRRIRLVNAGYWM
jgi:hypothetical protein